MKSQQLGTSTSPEVLGVTPNGIWLFTEGEEHFLSFELFPWFKKASVDAVFEVESMGQHGLHWPELDIDLNIEMLLHPENFPLAAKQ